jgi:hypothetical protein
VLSEAIYSFPSVAGLPDEHHVRLAFQDRSDSFTHQLMVVDGEDPDDLGVAQAVHSAAPPPGI